MPTYYDSQNNAHELSERIGSGGEGTVYQCAADYNLVAKIYHEPVTEEKAEKLRWMAANKNERLLKVAAWVVDVLTDAPGGKTVGFLMANVKAKEIHELYSLKSRRVYFPEATWHFLVHTAANVARAFYNLHRDRHIMGDVNHGNCVVMRDGTVKLIDCDSYSIKTDRLRYRCDVGVATHLAPELQGTNLRDIERAEKHDNFGLAVIVFQLLFLGRHPFAGNYLGDDDKSLEDCIREHRFAYGLNAAAKNVRQPPGTLPLEAVSPRIATMFERAFLTEDRPAPREWIEALEDLSRNLEACALHPGHLYFKELNDCPWCRIEAQTGLMLFPFVTSGAQTDGEKPFNIFTVENLIASFGIENNLPVKPAPVLPARLFPPSPEILEARKSYRKISFIVVPGHFIGLILLMSLFGVGAAFYFGLLLAFISISFLNSSHKSASQPLEEALTESQRKLAKLEKQKSSTEIPQVIGDDLVKIRKKVHDYQAVQLQSVNQLKLLEAETTRREFYKYLHTKKIADASILGISAETRRRLTAAGVKTADEIKETRLRHFYKIDDETIVKLIDWRGRLETDFYEDERTKATLKAEQTRFINEANVERRRIERDIEQLLILLRGSAVHLRKQQQQFFSKSEELVKQIAQAKSDLQALGSTTPAIIALVFAGIFVPSVGSALTGTSKQIYPPPAPSISQTGSGISGSTSKWSTAPDSAKSGSSLYGEHLTDREIKELSQSERSDFAEALYARALTYNYNNIDRAEAERYSRQALRFVSDDPRFLNQLGYALYGQTKYRESLKQLNRSLEINKENSETKILISMNYLAMKKFDGSVKLMEQVTKKYPGSFEAFYSLGLAYNGLNQYAKSEAAFRRASQINPSDADTHYQLGYCLNKLGKWQELRRQYDTLVTLDENIAQRLWTDTNLETVNALTGEETITIVQPASKTK